MRVRLRKRVRRRKNISKIDSQPTGKLQYVNGHFKSFDASYSYNYNENDIQEEEKRCWKIILQLSGRIVEKSFLMNE